MGMAFYELGQGLQGLAGRKMDKGWNQAKGLALACGLGELTEGLGPLLEMYSAGSGAFAAAAEGLGPVAVQAEEAAVAGKEASAGAINFMDQGDQFLQNAASRADVDANGVLDVVAHGDSDGMVINGTYMSASDAAQAISSNSQFAGQDLRLLSCSTGSCSTGFAKQLATKLNVSVTAPSDTLWAFPNGQLTIGPQPFANSGFWVTFRP